MFLSDPDYPPSTVQPPELMSPVLPYGDHHAKVMALADYPRIPKIWAPRFGAIVASNTGSLLLLALSSNQDRTAMGSMLVEPRAGLKREKGVREHRRHRIQEDVG